VGQLAEGDVTGNSSSVHDQNRTLLRSDAEGLMFASDNAVCSAPFGPADLLVIVLIADAA
jgi:hypothetical protein